MPYQHSGYIPLEAGKYYWIEALHKEGQRRDSLSVGYTLECPNTSPVLSETPILKPSLQYKIPSKLKLAKLQNVGVLTSDLTKLLPSRNIIDLKVHAMGLYVFLSKKLTQFFEVVIHFHPGDRKQKTLFVVKVEYLSFLRRSSG